MATDFDAYRSFGVEEIFLDETKSMRYDYDLKTNKDDLISARDEFIDFIYALNDLSTVEEIKAFYEKKMDVDLFLKTYACNVLLGMDDDYWNNKNNYYFYFDKKGKCYFIPYDYDNILGTNCFDDTATKNPIAWGRDGVNAPLIEKLLSVPEYKKMYVDYLLELSEETSFVTGSQVEIQRLQAFVKDYVRSDSDNLRYYDTSNDISDNAAPWCSNYGKYKLLSGDEQTNYFMAKAKSIADYTKEVQITFKLNGGTSFSITDDETQSFYDGDYLPNFGITKEEDNEFFIGWYDAADGGNQVEFATSDMTVYAHYHEFPYKYWIDDTDVIHLSFAFNPEDFGLSDNKDYKVIHACELSGWGEGESTVEMIKGVDGIYRCEYTSGKYAISKMWPGYKFIVDGYWTGPYDGYRYRSYLTPMETYEDEPSYNFLIKELMSSYK